MRFFLTTTDFDYEINGGRYRTSNDTVT